MRVALDPYMYRNLSLGKMVDKVAELGYEHIELSPREDFLPFYKAPGSIRRGSRNFAKP